MPAPSALLQDRSRAENRIASSTVSNGLNSPFRPRVRAFRIASDPLELDKSSSSHPSSPRSFPRSSVGLSRDVDTPTSRATAPLTPSPPSVPTSPPPYHR